jgi:predicted lysophospholipase L1 biosynthesis ABC-type transport system permease subunit
VVNRSFAKAYAGSGNILGRVIDFGGEDGKDAHYRVVGVVEDEHQLGPDSVPSPEFYVPGHALNSFYLLVRTADNPLSLAAEAQRQIWKLDPELPVTNVKSMDGALREWTAARRFVMNVLAAFAVLAIVLAGIGLFGVLAYTVTLRTREIGIRIAVGAEPRQVARSVLTHGCKLAIAGIALGFCGAIALGRYLQSLIYGVSPNDPFTFIVVPVLLGVIAAIASYAPARRAAAIDPVQALRAE